MLVRLAFSLMMQVDADVLLIDEVLAVGDAAFQQKCADAFHEMKAKGKTIVLVTHSMDTVRTYCDRAMLIDDGAVKMIGDPAEVGRQYLRLNFERDTSVAAGRRPVESDEVRLLDIWTESAAGARGAPVEQGEGLVVGAELEVLRDLRRSSVGFLLTNADGVGISHFGRLLDGGPGTQLVPAGSRVKVRARLDNPLVSGRYFLHLGVSRGGQGAGTALYVHNAVDFVVFGGRSRRMGWSTSGTRSRRSSRRQRNRERERCPELREVRGPSALGGGWRRFFDLLWLMSVTEFRRTYFGTVLGYLWSLVRPLLLFAVLLFVFTKIFRVGSDEVPNYPVMLLLGIVLFSFFQEATTSAVTSVVAQEGVVRKTQFPRLVIPTTVVLTALFNLCLNLVVVFVFILAYGVDPMWTWLLFPVALLALFVLTTAVSMLLSVLYVRFRDVAIIWAVPPRSSSTRPRSSTR